MSAQRLSLLAAVGGLAIGLVLFLGQLRQAQQLRQQLTTSQQQVASLDAKNQELGHELNSLQSDRNRLETRVSSLQSQLASAATDLERSRVGLEELKDRFDRLSEERTQLQVQVATVTTERNEARSRLQDTEQKKADLERSVGRLRERLTLLDRDYQQLNEKLSQYQASPPSSLSVVSAAGPTTTASAAGEPTTIASTIPGTVELPPIIVRKDQAGISLPVRARLLEVNEPHRFVVVDKGTADGVRVGMAFDIVRGNSTISRATVVRVRPQLSACDLIPQAILAQPQPGDLAIQSSP